MISPTLIMAGRDPAILFLSRSDKDARITSAHGERATISISVMPAKAGIQLPFARVCASQSWTPAFAGVTD